MSAGIPGGGQRLAETVATRIENEIIELGWPVGEVIGSERELMVRMGVSRSVLREAVRIVEHHDVARMRRGPGGGLVVTEPGSDAIQRAVALALRFAGVRREQLFEARAILELACVTRVTRSIDAGGIKRLRQILECEQALGARAIPTGQTHRLHTTIAELTGNPVLTLFVRVLIDLTMQQQLPHEDLESAIGAYRHAHDRLVDAIAAGDVETAQARMRIHLEAMALVIDDTPTPKPGLSGARDGEPSHREPDRAAYSDEYTHRRVRLGIYFDLRNPPQWQRPWPSVYENAIAHVQSAEALGIGSVWVTEHHFYEDGYIPQPFLFAAAVAARTEQIRIGTAIAVAGLRTAVDIAEQSAIVDIISGGRFELGLGAGYVAREFEAFNADVKDRFPSLEDRAREVRRLWADGGVAPPPVQAHVPIWIGTQGPRGARIAGRLGEGMLWLDHELFATYRDALVAAGHPESRARVSGLANMIVVDDPETAWARVAPHLAYQWTSYAANSRRSARRSGPTKRTLKRPLDEVMGSGEVDPETLRSPGPSMNPPKFDVVTPDDAVARLRAWLTGLPVQHLYFWASIAGMPDDLIARHVELLATAVAPAVADIGVPATTA